MSTVSIPLTLINLNDDGYHLLAEIKAYNVKRWAVIDTGASRSVFDKNFIEEHSEPLATVESSDATTLFSTSVTIQAVIPKLKIGKLKIRDYCTVALDLQTVNDAYKVLGHPPIIAIIGSDIFHEYQARINFKKLRLLLSTKG